MQSVTSENEQMLVYGRERLLSCLINNVHKQSNSFILGGPGTGKSCVLTELKKQLTKIIDTPCYLIACNPDLIETVWTKAVTHKHSIFLIDDIDSFIKDSMQDLSILRRLSGEEKCTFVISGFWSLYYSTILDYHSPLLNFGERFILNEIDDLACIQMCNNFFTKNHIHYLDRFLLNQIIDVTGKKPDLCLFICNELQKKIDPSFTRCLELTQHDLNDVLNSQAVFDKLSHFFPLLKSSIEDNKILEANKIDQFIIDSTVDLQDFSETELLDYFKKASFLPEFNSIEQSLMRLVLSFLLKKENDRYTYRIPLFKKHYSQLKGKTEV